MHNLMLPALIRLLYMGILSCLLLGGNMSASTASKQSQESKEWSDIAKLHDRGWREREKRDYKGSEKDFRIAARKLEKYRSTYIRDRDNLVYLRATYWIGYLYELGGEDRDAQRFYTQSIEHPLANTPEAIIDGELISKQAQLRLKVIEQRSQAKSEKSNKTYPQIRIKGGSKGGEKDLPAHSLMKQP